MLAAVKAGWLLPQLSVAELVQGILKLGEPDAELGAHSSDKAVGLLMDKSKSLLLLLLLLPPAAVGGLAPGSSVQHAVALLMLRYLLHLGSAAHFEVCS